LRGAQEGLVERGHEPVEFRYLPGDAVVVGVDGLVECVLVEVQDDADAELLQRSAQTLGEVLPRLELEGVADIDVRDGVEYGFAVDLVEVVPYVLGGLGVRVEGLAHRTAS